MRSDESEYDFRRGFLAGAAKKSMLATMPGRESQLLVDAQSADMQRANEALCCLLEYYEPDVVGFLVRKLPNHVINETWSEVIFRVTRRLHRPPALSMQRGKPFVSYLYRVARNAVLDAKVETSNATIGSLDLLLEQRPDGIPDEPASFEHDGDFDDTEMDVICYNSLSADVRDRLSGFSLISAQPARASREDDTDIFRSANGNSYDGRASVVWALSKLPPGHRACLILHDWFNLDFAAVGDAVGIPKETACLRAWTARKRMREDLAYRWWEEDGCSVSQLALDLRLDEKDVPGYIEEGRRLRAGGRTKQKRGGRNER